MADNKKHTALPWTARVARLNENAPAFGFSINAEGKDRSITSAGVYEHEILIAGEGFADITARHYTPEEVEANAIFITKAVNSHYELLVALCDCLVYIKSLNKKRVDEQQPRITRAANAIAKAEGR